MSDDTNALLASNVQYGPANELLLINCFGTPETRTYNGMLQLTSLTANNMNLQYRFPASQNNGKAATQKDVISGEEVQYTYDSLNRMIAASTTAASDQVTTPWGQGFGYDGFGNLNAKSVTKGSAPTMSISVDPATNRIVGRTYDTNGNLLSLPSGGLAQYDAENRLIAVPGLQYGYDASNKRVWKWDGSVNGNSNVYGIELYFYGIDGKRMGTYVPGFSNHNVQGYAIPPVLTDTATDQNLYFTGKLIAHGIPGSLVPFTQDRLGSAAKTYPYGEEKTPNGQDGIKFATYTRDTATNLDYADQRFYSSQWGRFMTADQGGPVSTNPQSWNRYSYSWNDPINLNDADGMKPGQIECGYPCNVSAGFITVDSIFAFLFQAGPRNPSDQLPTHISRNDPNFNWSPDWRKEVALENAYDALDGVRNSEFAGVDCEKDLGAIGVTKDMVKGAAANVNIVLDVQAQVQRVQQLFKDDPNNVAVTPIGGDLIYLQMNYALAFGSTSYGPSATLESTLMHELMHALGKTDSDLRSAFHFDSFASSGVVSDRLKEDCFSGKR